MTAKRKRQPCCAISCEGIGLTVQGTRESIAMVFADAKRHEAPDVFLLNRAGDPVAVDASAAWVIRPC